MSWKNGCALFNVKFVIFLKVKVMKKSILLPLLLLFALCASAQKPVVVNLWPNGAPNDNGITTPELVRSDDRIENISNATLTVFPSPKPNSKALICCPGGCYKWEAVRSEGADMAPFMNNICVTFIVLKYRLPNGGHDSVPLADANEAIRYVRQHAKDWNVDPNEVGIMGCSAGGHLAATAACYYDASSRPDFQVLVYPVISMDNAITHRLSRIMLIGNNPTEAMIDKYSMDKHVTKDSPRAFIMLCSDDNGVPPENSLRYYKSLLDNHVSVTMHIYPKGGHGFGFRDSMPFKTLWTSELEKWLSTF